jgi:hypothetical protein
MERTLSKVVRKKRDRGARNIRNSLHHLGMESENVIGVKVDNSLQLFLI